MPSSRDEDLDWLYGRSPRPDGPEPTRVLPPDAEGPVDARPAPSWTPPAPAPAPRPGPATTPGHDAPDPGRTPWAPPSGPPAAPPPAPAAAPPGRTGRTGRRRHPARTTLRTLALLVVLALVWLVGVPAYAWSQVGRVDDTPGGDRPGHQPGQTFLLVGSDSREGLSKAEQKKLGTGSTEGQRTDTIMLLHVPPGGQPALISIPRDSFVDIPGNGQNKINAAFAFGGAPLLEQTVEQSTGLRVDGYLEIGFGGFVNVIDALGGIEMCLPKAIEDEDSHLDLEKGCQELDGTTALGYVRMRKADPRGDLGRVERQREMLAAVASKAASPATVLNPVRYWRLCNASARSVRLGEDTSLWQVGTLALAMRTVAAGDGLTLTVPIADPDASTSAGSAVLWDEEEARAMFDDIARGDTSDLDRYAR
ncbi:cell envelope-related function transcriptional attenuator common domain-containing protein [Friedmanniella luteola]|uniref:Cell envelope-related function transcriptional attenuator common domain-containing protein n=1 Tax=Friedmanniella luteola TaxID=546871 RepID=A0A1H1YI01_9ACTN|nr:LCP family protein [Friedmanniella luteola]SDT21052.1 cell envelope-related function transcriptional attenuator common domain-containing protein [Friedmanniella luteola]